MSNNLIGAMLYQRPTLMGGGPTAPPPFNPNGAPVPDWMLNGANNGAGASVGAVAASQGAPAPIAPGAAPAAAPGAPTVDPAQAQQDVGLLDALFGFGGGSKRAKLTDDERRQVLIDAAATIGGSLLAVGGRQDATLGDALGVGFQAFGHATRAGFQNVLQRRLAQTKLQEEERKTAFMDAAQKIAPNDPNREEKLRALYDYYNPEEVAKRSPRNRPELVDLMEERDKRAPGDPDRIAIERKIDAMTRTGERKITPTNVRFGDKDVYGHWTFDEEGQAAGFYRYDTKEIEWPPAAPHYKPNTGDGSNRLLDRLDDSETAAARRYVESLDAEDRARLVRRYERGLTMPPEVARALQRMKRETDQEYNAWRREMGLLGKSEPAPAAPGPSQSPVKLSPKGQGVLEKFRGQYR